MEIQEQIITNWDEEPEPLNFLRKDFVHGLGGIELNVKQIVRRQLQAKSGKEYQAYRIYASTENAEYVIGDLMRSDLKWNNKQKTPSRIHVSVEKKGDYFNWIIKPI